MLVYPSMNAYNFECLIHSTVVYKYNSFDVRLNKVNIGTISMEQRLLSNKLSLGKWSILMKYENFHT